MNFIPALGIPFQIANSCTRWRYNLTGLSQDGGRADFSKNLRASLFNAGLSNEPNFGRIHLAETSCKLPQSFIFARGGRKKSNTTI
jgi:hypothetical protein